MKIVFAPDSFKESLTSRQVAETMARAFAAVFPEAKLELAPLADGGEGTVEALCAAQGVEQREVEVSGPLGEPIAATYGLLPDRSAVVEAATAFGLTQVPPEQRDPYRTTTRGMGELIRLLLDQGVRQFIVGLGGSATNDGGMGLLAALGARFEDAEGRPLAGFGEDLLALARVDLAELDPRLAACDIVVASDVKNPLCGPEGASAVFGPQKGARPEQVAALDAALLRFGELLEAQTGRACAAAPGAGAAGGAGFALLSLGAKVRPGAEVVATASGLPTKLAGADWVVTGEGRSDRQTLSGKLPHYVAGLAREAGAAALLISGSLGAGAEELEADFAACFACVPGAMTLAECLANAEANLLLTARNAARLIRAAQA